MTYFGSGTGAGALFIEGIRALQNNKQKEIYNFINRYGGFAGILISLLYMVCLGDELDFLWLPFIFLGILFFLHTIFRGFIFFKKSMPIFDKFFLYFFLFYFIGFLCILLWGE